MKTTITSTLLCLALTSTSLIAAEVRIAVAANFTNTARQLAPLFKKTTGHTTRISYGSSGKLFAQIENGAPFDLYMSADTRHPIKAEQEGLAVPGSRFIYAKGQLVLWSRTTDLFEFGASWLKTAPFQHAAIGNPKTAPYGLAAQQVLQELGIWQTMQPRLVRGDSIAQAFQFVATGNAKIGFVAYAQVKAWRGDSGSLWVIPTDLYAPIEQAVVLLKRGEDNPAALAYLDFLKSDAARDVIKGLGYDVE